MEASTEAYESINEENSSPYYVYNISALPYLQYYLIGRDVITPVSVLTILAGFVSNVLNILVFLKMGVRDMVKVSLLALSISDLAFLVVISPHIAELTIRHLFVFRLKVAVNWPFDFLILNVPFYWYAYLFYETSTLITVYTAVVRCACVAMPLRVKTAFTPLRAVVAFFIIFLCLVLLRLQTFMTRLIVSEFDPATNRTWVAYRTIEDGGIADAINDVVNRTVLPWSSFIIVAVSVAVMTIKLQASARFRLSASSSNATAEYGANTCMTPASYLPTEENSPQLSTTLVRSRRPVSTKEAQVVRSVMLVAVVFITCQIPFLTNALVRRIDPRFDNFITNSGRYPKHLYLYAMSSDISKLFSLLNASVNLCIYYSVNKRYRQLLRELLCGSNHKSDKQ